jgi:hypothetical protein
MRIKTVLPAVVMAVCILHPGAAAAQRLTIPQSIEKSRPNAPHWSGRIRELAPRSFADVVQNSDLILVATLRKVGTYLSSDQTELYTDFEILPVTTIAARAVPGTNNPGPQTMILRQWGGSTVISGVNVEMKDENFPLLQANTSLLLLLTLNKESGTYEVFDGIFGGFQLEGGRKLRHLGTPAQYERLSGVDIQEAIREIHRLV